MACCIARIACPRSFRRPMCRRSPFRRVRRIRRIAAVGLPVPPAAVGPVEPEAAAPAAEVGARWGARDAEPGSPRPSRCLSLTRHRRRRLPRRCRRRRRLRPRGEGNRQRGAVGRGSAAGSHDVHPRGRRRGPCPAAVLRRRCRRRLRVDDGRERQRHLAGGIRRRGRADADPRPVHGPVSGLGSHCGGGRDHRC